MSSDLWAPPGPGSWKLDVTHMRGPVELLQMESFAPALEDGFRDSFAQLGFALGNILFRAVPSGWLYGCAVPITADQMPDRIAAASRVLAERPWRRQPEIWANEQRPAFVAKIREIQRQDPSKLDDGALAQHVRAASRLVYDGFRLHIENYSYTGTCVGDWLVQAATWARTPPWEVVGALAGYSPASAMTLVALDELAAAVRGADKATALFAKGLPTLVELRASAPTVADALDRYLDEYGDRTVSGFHISDVTLREEPQLLIKTLAAVLEPDQSRPALRKEADAVAARLREKVPAENRAEYDSLLADARHVYGSNDVDVVVLLFWSLGLLRRAALAAGRRLHAAGRIHGPEHTFDATADEVTALLTGAPGAISAATLDARFQQRLAYAKLDAPLYIGDPPQGPPPPGVLPPPVERITNAFGLAWTLVDEDGSPLRPPSEVPSLQLAGHGASVGVYEGTARVIHGPADFGRLRRRDVLVARTTSPTYNIILPLVGAIVTDRGGVLCHAAIVSREFGIPAVVGTGTATRDIPDGARVRVDGNTGTVHILT